MGTGSFYSSAIVWFASQAATSAASGASTSGRSNSSSDGEAGADPLCAQQQLHQQSSQHHAPQGPQGQLQPHGQQQGQPPQQLHKLVLFSGYVVHQQIVAYLAMGKVRG